MQPAKENESVEDRKNIWRRGLTLDLRKTGKTWGEVKNIAQDRGRRKATVVALCPPWDEVDLGPVYMEQGCLG